MECKVAKYLVIVESPAKVKSIKKFLGSNYEVMASKGHVRDLPKSQLGVDVENDYEPKYITIRGKGDVVASLRKAAKKAEKVYLATDPDREGEAISWHLTKALKLEEDSFYRITFNEITKNAVKDSIKNARKLDMNLVDAQQTRRILDRMVGYKISPILWNKIKRGLSAGRVQSVALRIICDREAEIEAFNQKEYWTIEALIKAKGINKTLVTKYIGNEKGKKEITSRAEADEILKSVKGKEFKVIEVKKSERVRKAPLPFTTSTLQQEAGKALNFPSKKTMSLAQKLYEGVDLDKETVGIITYLRTDSTRISEEAEGPAQEFIKSKYGKEYVNLNVRDKRGGQKIQDAHEAIRPTDINRTPESLKLYLSRDELRLYTLIWKRFLASRMQDARYEATSVKLKAGENLFQMNASRLSFDGFMSVYMEAEETEGEKDASEDNTFTGNISEETKISVEDIIPKQHFTQPPSHYTESSLIRALEELGIGRPSTYAPTISNILGKHYVTKEGKNLFITDLGEAVNNMMNEAFPTIVDVNFTANMETLLDGIGEGNIKWKTVVENFYPDLKDAVDKAEKELEHVKIADEVSEEICDLCGKNMVIKYGPHGKFLACPGFPDCRNTKPYLEKIGVSCPECGKELVIRHAKSGRKFYGCIDYPNCQHIEWRRPKAVEEKNQ